LAQGERTVEELTEVSGLSYANCSQHLQQLKAAGLMTGRKAGLYVHYRVTNDLVLENLFALTKIAQRNLAEVDRLVELHLHGKDRLEPLSSAELLERLAQAVTLIDLRPHSEFATGPSPGR